MGLRHQTRRLSPARGICRLHALHSTAVQRPHHVRREQRGDDHQASHPRGGGEPKPEGLERESQGDHVGAHGCGEDLDGPALLREHQRRDEARGRGDHVQHHVDAVGVVRAEAHRQLLERLHRGFYSSLLQTHAVTSNTRIHKLFERDLYSCVVHSNALHTSNDVDTNFADLRAKLFSRPCDVTGEVT